MGWEALIPIIAQYGLPVAEALWKKWSTKTLPTQADWDELNKMANQTAADRMKARLVAASIDPASDQGKILLGLAG